MDILTHVIQIINTNDENKIKKEAKGSRQVRWQEHVCVEHGKMAGILELTGVSYKEESLVRLGAAEKELEHLPCWGEE